MLRLFTAIALLASHPLAAQQPAVYRCTDAAGTTSYQGEPCSHDSRQTQPELPALNVVPAPLTQRPPVQPQRPPVPAQLPSITFFYDPAGQPEGYSAQQMETAIRTALTAWSGCQVRLAYGGQAPARLPGTPQHVSIRWEQRYLLKRHPAHEGTGIAGTGSLQDGIRLRPIFLEARMPKVLVHEIGHVLGLPHNHEDAASVMSYLNYMDRVVTTESQQRELTPAELRRWAQPSAADLRACDLSVRKMFGADAQPNRIPPQNAARLRMTDREALERLKQGRGPGD